MLDLSFLKIAVLGVIALVVFGPDQLPRMAAQAGTWLRDLRRLAEGARADLQQQLGPEFDDFDLNDLNPRHFVRKHLLDGLNGDTVAAAGADYGAGIGARRDSDLGSLLLPGETPPYDAEAT